MRVIAFVGPSGTGKSYRSVKVSKQYGADAIIDDGILVSGGRLLAGSSAKKQPTRLTSVKHALFMKPGQGAEVRRALIENDIKCVMILGTSDGMVEKIAGNIGIGPIEQTIYINDVASEEEMKLAKTMRVEKGQHVIPVPTFEIKLQFSGYFLHPLKQLHRNISSTGAAENEKSIVRPTFSYMGDYTISDRVLSDMAAYEARKVKGVARVLDVVIRKTNHGAHIDMTVRMRYGYDLIAVGREIQQTVIRNIERYTSVNARRVHVYVKSLERK